MDRSVGVVGLGTMGLGIALVYAQAGFSVLATDSFPAARADQLMLVTDQAKLIRMGLDSLRVIGRGSAGVRLFNVADNEHVVSAAKIEESDEVVETPEADTEAGEA